MLRKSEKGWMFIEEHLLEDFIWDSLENTLDLIPLKRQLCITGEYCDILARTKNNQLVVLELKNCEDRYIIHQLTRYYHGLKTEKPFKDVIDYSLPIRLIAIAPDFHKHNFIDRRYNLLQFEFIRFSVINQTNDFHLHFHLEGRKEVTIETPIPFIQNREPSLPTYQVDLPPRVLINFLDKLSPTTKKQILRLREELLGSNQRIKELKDGRSIFYGRGKTKPCCQLKFISSTKTEEINNLHCYLWLPVPKSLLRSNQKNTLGRMHLNCDSDFQAIKTITYWTEISRFANMTPMPINLYLDEIGLDQANQDIDNLFNLAVRLNLERI